MGVRGMSSYVTACQRSCAEHVELGIVDGQPADRAVRRLAVDGLALVYHVMGNAKEHHLHLELGCDYLALASALRDYLSALVRAGVTPVVIMDGMQDREKEKTTLLRRRAQVEEAWSLMEHIGIHGVGACTGVGSGARSPTRLSLLPLFSAEALAAACRAAGVPCRTADREADPELAAACHPRSRSPKNAITHAPEPAERESGVGIRETDGVCDAVLSNDSDFLVMDIPGYIPFWALGLGEDGSAGALVFRRNKLAARLGIPTDCLPELACLIGNDWIQPEERVYRVIMGTAADNRPEGKDNLHGSSGQKKRRKGTSGSSPIGNHSSAPSAKDFVETTARFLASFYAQQRSSLRGKACCSAGNRIETNSESRGDRVVEEIVEAPVEGGLHGRNAVCRNRADGEKEQAGITPGDGSGRESHESHDVALCARFFPQLAKRSMEPIGSAKNSSRARGCLTVEDDCDNTGDQGDTGSSIATAGTDERAEETTAPQPSISKDMSKVAGRGNVRNKGKKGKSGKSRRVPPINSRTRGVTARKEGGTGAQKERGDGDEAVSGGDEFLKSFRRAKLRFTIPLDKNQEPQDSGSSASMSDKIKTAHGGSVFAATRPVAVLSSVGLRAGISAPPELAQAVLEGVFWSRVMLEDDPTREEEARQTADQCLSRATTPYDATSSSPFKSSFIDVVSKIPSQPVDADHRTTFGTDSSAAVVSSSLKIPHSEDHRSKSLFAAGTRGMSASDSSGIANSDDSPQEDGHETPAGCSSDCSAFGSFCEVRRRLYELCLALRAGTANCTAVDTTSSSVHGNRSAPCVGTRETFISASDRTRSGETSTERRLEQIMLTTNEVENRWQIDEAPKAGKPAKARLGNMALAGFPAYVEGSQGIEAGSRWVVKEFRRLESSVKAVFVPCLVPPALRLSSSAFDLTRWNLCLSVLGLEHRDNRRLTALAVAESVPSPAREPTAAGDERHESIGREEPCGLAGVALVAALLLSTSSTKSTNPAGASTARNYFDSTRRECCSYEIALAFAVAATQWTHMPCCDFATGIDGSDRRGARHGFSCHMTGGERGTAPLKTVSIPGESCSSQSRYGMTARADDCGCGQSQHSGNDSARSTDIPGTTERVVNHGKAVQQARRRSAACGDRGQHAVGKVRRAPNGQTTQATGGKVGNRSRKEAREPTSATAAPCEACLSKYVFELIRRDDAREANIGKIDRRFINLWSHVQSAVWHVNACHSILGLQQPRRLSGEASSSSKQRHNVGDVVLDPLRLRPALALLVYRRRRRLHRSQQYQRQSGPNSQMQNEQLPSENVARTRRHRRGSLPPTSEPSLQTDYLGSLSNSAPRKQLEREQHVRPDRDGRRSDSASNTGQGVRDSRGLISSLRPRRHPRQVAHTRRAGSSGIEGRRQELTEDKSVAWVVVEGCKGTCAWARRVRTVMEAATS